MKRLALLKTLTVIAFVICIIALFFTIPFILMVAVMPGQIPFKINGLPATQIGIETILLMLVVAVGCCFFVYALYLFKKTLELFERKKVFHDDVIKNLNQTGWAILIGELIYMGALFLHNTVVEGSFEINVSGNIFFVLGLSLFFMVLSDIFLMAKRIKDENDLTV